MDPAIFILLLFLGCPSSRGQERVDGASGTVLLQFRFHTYFNNHEKHCCKFDQGNCVPVVDNRGRAGDIYKGRISIINYNGGMDVTIRNLQKSDGGGYRCVVLNSQYQAPFKDFTVVIPGVQGVRVLNGAVGESIVLPTDEERPIKGPGFMQWRKNNIVFIKLVSKQNSSTFETKEINANFVGRVIVNYKTGALNISSLGEEDSGEYAFNGLGSFGPLGRKTIHLHVYERIFSMQVTSKVNYSTDNSICNVTLSCNVIGGSQVALFWSRNGEKIAGAKNRTTLNVSPTHAEEDYTCMAINPVSSLNNTVTARPCQTPVSPGLSPCEIKAVLFALGLVAMVSAVIAVHARERCCRDQWGHRKKDESVREV